MIKGHQVFALATLLVSAVCAADEVTVVGLDKNHQEISMAVSEKDYAKTFSDTLTAVHDSAITALETREQNSTPAPYWMLRDVTVGLGLTFTAGLGPIYSVSAAPRVRVCFSNSTHPKFPD